MRTVEEIDRELDAVQATLRRLARIRNPWDAEEWTRAWDAFPGLFAASQVLLSERYDARFPG